MKTSLRYFCLICSIAVVFLYTFLSIHDNSFQKTVDLVNLNFEKFLAMRFARFDKVLVPGFILMCFLIYDFIVELIFEVKSFYSMIIVRDKKWLAKYAFKIGYANAQLFLMIFMIQSFVGIMVFGIDFRILGLLSLFLLKLCLVFVCVSFITMFLAIGKGGANTYTPFILLIFGLIFDISLSTHFMTISDTALIEVTFSIGYGLCAFLIYQYGIRSLTRKGELA